MDGVSARSGGVDTVSDTEISAWHFMAFAGPYRRINPALLEKS
ncbi:hypothetical protein [Caballeronia sp. SEWSISQ10-4 2]|nr:hypothetical protein [Caballeronia sp. SEWSISQ10-4 2]